jgi:hypothetical protein
VSLSRPRDRPAPQHPRCPPTPCRTLTGNQPHRPRARDNHTLFTTYTPGTVAVNAHFSWGPMYATDVMLDWLFAQERDRRSP